MSDFSLIGGGSKILSCGFDDATLKGVLVTSSASTNTLGVYSELCSAAENTFKSNSVQVVLDGKIPTETVMLVDIAIGEDPNEVVILPQLLHRSVREGAAGSYIYNFPVNIPSGVRVAARCRAAISSGTAYVSIMRGPSSFQNEKGLSSVVAYGANISTSTGVTVTPVATPTFGAWTEITPSTTQTHRGLVVSATRAAGFWASRRIGYQVAIGSVGNEEIIYGTNLIIISSAETGDGVVTGFLGTKIPSGQRLSIRATADDIGASDFEYMIYGVS